MKKLERFVTLEEFRKAYDNGGYFWNLFSRPGDHVITKGEVAKAALAPAANAYAVLQFEMQREGLDEESRGRALGMLDAKMRARHRKFSPVPASPSRLEAEAESGRTAIVEGFARPHPEPEAIGGMVATFTVVGDAVIPTAVPIHNHADVYIVFDGEDERGRGALLAVARKTRLPTRKLRIGGTVAGLVPVKGKRCLWSKYLAGHFFVLPD